LLSYEQCCLIPVNHKVLKLDIAEGLKQLLIDANITIESIISLGYREISEILHIDPYVGQLIVVAARNVIQQEEGSPGPDLP
jgi:hypothetical protein